MIKHSHQNNKAEHAGNMIPLLTIMFPKREENTMTIPTLSEKPIVSQARNWRFKDITGERYGRLIALELVKKETDTRAFWLGIVTGKQIGRAHV